MRDLQHHCDEQTEIIETMIEVEAEDKSHVRALKKDVQVSFFRFGTLEQPKTSENGIFYRSISHLCFLSLFFLSLSFLLRLACPLIVL